VSRHSKFVEIGLMGSNIIFCQSLIGPRVSSYLLSQIQENIFYENDGYGPFKTLCIGNVSTESKFNFVKILDSVHSIISKQSHMAMGRKIHYIPNRPSFYSIKLQEIGQVHDEHSDNDPSTIRGEGRESIVMSSIISLSSDYEGGFLEFPEYNISIKLGSGDCVFFPSHGHWHSVSEVFAGERYSLMHFWE
jgi:hypothetical protein